MIIKNIVIAQLQKVLNSLPKGTTRINIEYRKDEDGENSEIVIYPSDSDSGNTNTNSDVQSPSIPPDTDIFNLL